MESHPLTLEDAPWRWERPEPTMPPDLEQDRELAWAWAMDNFPALCRPTCTPGRLREEPSCGEPGPLRPACPWAVGVPGADKGQQRRPDPPVQDASSHPGEAGVTHRNDPRLLNQPGDASTRGDGETDAPGASLSPRHPRKRLKTQDEPARSPETKPSALRRSPAHPEGS